jgi:prepilin-type N-terminal cleavage/methylation domain-containing protein
MPQPSRPASQSGFSLIELLIAMVVTMVVMGAVYGLMAGGNNAFRREPELTERQQNARVAVEMIQKDISNAGVNMGPFFQSFTQNLNAAGRVTGPTGLVADHLEVFGNDGTCPDSPAKPAINPVTGKACNGQECPTSGSNFNSRGPIPDCYSEEALVLVIYSNGAAKWGLGHNIHAKDFKLNFPPGQQPNGSQINSPGELAEWANGDGTTPQALSPLNMVRYEIAFDPPGVAPPVGVPSLFRSVTGGRDPADGGYAAPDSAANLTKGRWLLLARGIEDLQVQYRNGALVWADDPGAVTCAGQCKTPNAVEYNRGVREVRVTMSVRAEAYNLQGQTRSLASSRADAVRGSVTTVTSVKALQNYLAAVAPTPACPTCPVWR